MNFKISCLEHVITYLPFKLQLEQNSFEIGRANLNENGIHSLKSVTFFGGRFKKFENFRSEIFDSADSRGKKLALYVPFAGKKPCEVFEYLLISTLNVCRPV